MPDYRRYRCPGACYFFTVNLLQRYPNDTLVRYVDTLREVVREVRRQRPFHIDGWVIMPDHLHCVWTLPPGDADFTIRWRLIKAGFAKRLPNIESRLVGTPGARRARNMATAILGACDSRRAGLCGASRLPALQPGEAWICEASEGLVVFELWSLCGKGFVSKRWAGGDEDEGVMAGDYGE